MTYFRSGAGALFCLLALLGCRPAEQEEPANDAINSAASRLPPVPVVEPPRDRASLMLAIMRAASAAALGGDDAAAQRELDGKRFEFRIRFGCSGPRENNANGSAFSYRFDPETRRLQLSAAPTVAADDPAIRAFAGEDVETVEGFWIDRPWLLSAGCPKLAQPPSPPGEEGEPAQAAQDVQRDAVTPVLPRAAIAQFLTANDPRTARRGTRPYTATKTLAENVEPSGQGYDLVLSGRLRALPGGKVIACDQTSADLPPTCVVSALFDRVWIARPGTGEIIAEWGRN